MMREIAAGDMRSWDEIVLRNANFCYIHTIEMLDNDHLTVLLEDIF